MRSMSQSALTAEGCCADATAGGTAQRWYGYYLCSVLPGRLEFTLQVCACPPVVACCTASPACCSVITTRGNHSLERQRLLWVKQNDATKAENVGKGFLPFLCRNTVLITQRCGGSTDLQD